MKGYMKRLQALVFLFLVLLFTLGCEEQESKKPRTEPVTSFGKAVQSSKDLSNSFDERNSDLEQQADLLEEE